MKTTKHTKVREWYIETYPRDELGFSLAKSITFEDVFNAIDHRKDVYKLFEVDDSIVRENIFAELAVIMEVDYDYIYKQWLLCDEDAGPAMVEVVIRLYTCPECKEETLRYAIIDPDGTNLEEGYSCSECNTDFVGIDNEQVTNSNPEIAEQ